MSSAKTVNIESSFEWQFEHSSACIYSCDYIDVSISLIPKPDDTLSIVLSLLATPSWPQWGCKSCVSCSATGMELVLSARARWDVSPIYPPVLSCINCKLRVSIDLKMGFQIERFIRMGIPPSLRGRVWKCLLTIDSLREASEFNYQVRCSLNYCTYTTATAK